MENSLLMLSDRIEGIVLGFLKIKNVPSCMVSELENVCGWQDRYDKITIQPDEFLAGALK